jgi:hypothetical protein
MEDIEVEDDTLVFEKDIVLWVEWDFDASIVRQGYVNWVTRASSSSRDSRQTQKVPVT